MPLGKVVGPCPGHIVLDGDPVGTQSPTAAPPHFRPMRIVAKRSPISATAELLLRYASEKAERQKLRHKTVVPKRNLAYNTLDMAQRTAKYASVYARKFTKFTGALPQPQQNKYSILHSARTTLPSAALVLNQSL